MTNHREQKEKALWASLRQAGIGRAYHQRSIAELGQPHLTEWVESPFADLAAGRGWSFVGTTPAYDAAMLTARALHIQGQGCRVVPLHRLAAWVRADSEELDRAYDVRGLFVTGFFSTMHEIPLQGWVTSGVEAYLTERLDDNLSVFLQMEKAETGGWWTPRFIEQLADRNRSLAI